MNTTALQRDQLLLDAIEQIAAARDTSRAVSLLRKTGRRAIRCDGLSLMLREAGEIRPVAEDSASSVAGCILMRETGIASMAIAQRRRLIVADVGTSELIRPDLRDSSRVRSLAAIPVGSEMPFGALVACWDRPGAVTSELVDTIEFLAAALGRTLQATRLIDVLPLLLFTARPDGSCEHLGRQWLEYGIGIGHESDLGWRDMALHPADRPLLARQWSIAVATQSAFEADHRLLHRDAGYRWFRTRAVPVHDPAGRLLHWAGTSTEIDALVEARMAETVRCEQIERRLRDEIADRARSGARLAKTERIEAIGQLTSGVAHDFNNLLTVIIGNLEFLEAEAVDAAPSDRRDAALASDGRLRARLSAMRQAAERGGNLTRQLLAFARRQRLDPRPTDLNDIVAGMRSLLPSVIGGLRVEAAPEPGLWAAFVDRTQIERMLLNLALNAHDAMPAGGAIVLATRNRRVAAVEADAIGLQGAGDFVEVSVTDSGSGMTPQVLARAFEPFFTTKPAGTGSGLGLAQLWGFAQQSGGVVTIRSTQGEGTSVAILLPRAHAGIEPQHPSLPQTPDAPVVRHEPASGVATDHRLPPDRLVLLVDDDAAVREVTSTIVAEAGYRVVEASSGLEALERLGSIGPVDLMVTDYAMPGMNGFELARAARVQQSDLKVLFVTGYADLTALGDTPETGILLKPFRGARLLDKISGVLHG